MERFIKVAPETYIVERNKMKENKYKSAFLTFYPRSYFKDCTCYLSQNHDQKVGYAIHNRTKEIFGLFNNSGVQGLGKHAICDSIEQGADNLFCFDILCPLYNQFGFKIYNIDRWDDKFAPRFWDYHKYGRPNVVWMKLK